MVPMPASTLFDKATDPVADAHCYRRVLHELIDMGADLARMVHAEARSRIDLRAEAQTAAGSRADRLAAGELTPAADATVAFDRIARAIRRTVSLARRLDEPVPARETVQRAAAEHRAAARRLIIRAVEDAIQRQPSDDAAWDTEGDCYAELEERLDGPDLDDDIDHRPVGDIIVDICRDLGIAAAPGMRPWKRRPPADIAALCARAAARPGAGSRAPCAATPGDLPDADAGKGERPFRVIAPFFGPKGAQPPPRPQADDG